MLHLESLPYITGKVADLATTDWQYVTRFDSEPSESLHKFLPVQPDELVLNSAPESK